MKIMNVLVCGFILVYSVTGFNPNLPEIQLPMFYSLYPSLDPGHSNNSMGRGGTCWGYEANCTTRLSAPTCPGDFNGWAKTKEEAEQIFYSQTDFGYVKARRGELKDLCLTDEPASSSLRCSSSMQFCEAENILIDFSKIGHRVRTENLRYKMDVLGFGDIKLHCHIDLNGFQDHLGYMSPLQSWAPELRNVRRSDVAINSSTPGCDLYMEKTVYLMKLDAVVNMYHHFCDFFNLYTSLFIKTSRDGRLMFDTDNQVIIWENFKYSSNFGVTWDAFTSNPLWNLENVAGLRVCFKNVVFPLLPRMLYGLFYNTPIITGCQDSGLFTAFSEFIVHRLNVQTAPPSNKLRITLLSRSTRYRRILNEAALVKALELTGRFQVYVARFDHSTPFLVQLERVRSTDLLVGVHGAGLSHLLFLPPWAAVLELYHCEDPGCYSDLARLRGLKYMTWEYESKLTAHEAAGGPYTGPAHQKFRNYEFDVAEFLRLVEIMETSILADYRFIEAKNWKNGPDERFEKKKDEL